MKLFNDPRVIFKLHLLLWREAEEKMQHHLQLKEHTNLIVSWSQIAILNKLDRVPLDGSCMQCKFSLQTNQSSTT